MTTRSFDACPFCGYKNTESTHAGFTSIEFAYANAEIRLWNGTFVEHRHVNVNLPEPWRLAESPDQRAMVPPKVELVTADTQCARCGSSVGWEPCEECDGEGADEAGFAECNVCNGTAYFHFCLADAEWCESHPRPGKEDVPRGTPEHFEVYSDGSVVIVREA